MIKVDFSVYATRYHIDKAIQRLFQLPVMSFDVETSGVYSKKERAEALRLLKNEDLPLDQRRLSLQVSTNSGLSFPSLVSVTHFVFGEAEDRSTIFVCDNPGLEYHIWTQLKRYQGLMLIHNTLFDLKIMYHRVKALPQNYEDTALIVKTLTNHVDTWKSKVGLKELMGVYYDPKWALMDEYEPAFLKEPAFLSYASIDGAATFKLWNDVQNHLNSGED